MLERFGEDMRNARAEIMRQITEEEFFVTDEWIGSMRRLSDLQKKLRGWLSLEDLLDADQFDVVHGNQ